MIPEQVFADGFFDTKVAEEGYAPPSKMGPLMIVSDMKLVAEGGTIRSADDIKIFASLLITGAHFVIESDSILSLEDGGRIIADNDLTLVGKRNLLGTSYLGTSFVESRKGSIHLKGADVLQANGVVRVAAKKDITIDTGYNYLPKGVTDLNYPTKISGEFFAERFIVSHGTGHLMIHWADIRAEKITFDSFANSPNLRGGLVSANIKVFDSRFKYTGPAAKEDHEWLKFRAQASWPADPEKASSLVAFYGRESFVLRGKLENVTVEAKSVSGLEMLLQR